jgi:hypothetical protein
MLAHVAAVFATLRNVIWSAPLDASAAKHCPNGVAVV